MILSRVIAPSRCCRGRVCGGEPPSEAALADVKRIYVDQLGGGKTSDQFRDMLIAAIQTPACLC